MPTLRDYHKSITRELISTNNRVRDLITHWPEDGRYKEVILKNIIKRVLPKNLSIYSGFVIKQTENRGKHVQSRQIDLIIYENSYPILFVEGDFAIVTPEGVKGIIEIKANLANQQLDNIFSTCNENAEFIFNGKENRQNPLFNGIFSFNGRQCTEFFRNQLRISYNNNNHTEKDKFILNHINTPVKI